MRKSFVFLRYARKKRTQAQNALPSSSTGLNT